MSRSRAFALASLMTASGLVGCGGGNDGTVTPPVTDPIGRDIFTRGAEVLTWSQAQKIAFYPKMDSLFPAHIARRGAAVHDLPIGAPLTGLTPTPAAAQALTDYITSQQVAGLLIIQNGRIRLERYGLGQTATSRWTSFSVVKSITSTLVGAAIKDGSISSIDAPLTNYISELRGTAYDGVTVRHLLTMSSGVAWNESYTDPNSDIVRFTHYKPVAGLDANVGFVSTLRREATPGTKWLYKTPETNLLGTLVIAATGKPLATYLSEKIWSAYGMERDAAWLTDHIGHEQGGVGLQATLRDFGRYGQLVLDDGVVNGQSIVPAGWYSAATRKQFDIGVAGSGYGYQWWTYDTGTFEARGIFGQLVHVDPARKLVVVVLSAWNDAVGGPSPALQRQLVTAIENAVDAER
jgi:CubicO group peptidase (beta-lactamase class C family)